MRRAWLVLFLAAFTSATAASAQNAAARAAHTFVVSGAPGLGLFWRGSDATDVGIFLNGSATSQENQDSRSISVEPTVRHYWRPEARLTPYTHLALVGTWTRRKVENPTSFATMTTEARTLALGIEAALGLEWFPIERVSVGGHAGLRVSQGWVRTTTSAVGMTTQVQNQHQTTVATLQSGLEVRFYF
jgi:hypothetical protein